MGLCIELVDLFKQESFVLFELILHKKYRLSLMISPRPRRHPDFYPVSAGDMFLFFKFVLQVFADQINRLLYRIFSHINDQVIKMGIIPVRIKIFFDIDF